MLKTIAIPFGWLMLTLYNITGNYGLAIILFALVVNLILLPFMMKSKKGMMRMTRLQPKIAELQRKHEGNQQKLNEEMSKLYREEKANPMSGCLWTLIPFPILIALYQAIRLPITTMMGVPSALMEEGGAIYQKLAELGWLERVNPGKGFPVYVLGRKVLGLMPDLKI
jgi:YidC/Oxa1 family membrane protein insertase